MSERWVTVVLLLALVLYFMLGVLPSVPTAWRIGLLIVFVVATIYMVVQNWAPDREAEPLEAEASVPAKPGAGLEEYIYTYIAERYGVGYRWLDVDCGIARDGSARVRRSVMVDVYSETAKLDTFLMIPEEPPEGERVIDLVEARSLTEGHELKLDLTKRFQMLYGEMSISPQLGAGDTFEYEMIERLPKGLYAIDLTEEQLARRSSPLEYFGMSVNRPTRELFLNVWFPERIRPEVYGVEVRLAPAVPGMPKRTIHQEERARLPKLVLGGPEAGRYYLKQVVKYPMIGLIYLLWWEPLESRGRSMHP